VTIAAISCGCGDLAGLLVSLGGRAHHATVEELAEATGSGHGRWGHRELMCAGRTKSGNWDSVHTKTRTLQYRRKAVQTEPCGGLARIGAAAGARAAQSDFSMQLTVENSHGPSNWRQAVLEVFNESPATLKTELANLNTIVDGSRFFADAHARNSRK